MRITRLVRWIDKYVGHGVLMLCFPWDWLTNSIPQFPVSARRILLVKLPGIGNIVMLSPAMRAIRSHFPQARIYFLTLANNVGILEDNPLVDEKILLELSSVGNFVKSVVRAMVKIRRENIELVFDFEQFAKISTVLAVLAGVPYRVGFDTRGQGRGWMYHTRVVYDDRIHTVESFASLVARCHIPVEDLRLSPISYTDREKEKVEVLLRKAPVHPVESIIGIHPGTGSNFPERRWPKERFTELADRLIAEEGVRIVFTGDPSEHALVQSIQRLMKQEALNLCGHLNVRELAALISRCRLFISNDTAPVHIAAAMGIPVVGLYGPNTPRLYGPWCKECLVFYKGLPCSPCITNFNQKTSTCKDPQCMNQIGVEEVFLGIRERFLKTSGRASSVEASV